MLILHLFAGSFPVFMNTYRIFHIKVMLWRASFSAFGRGFLVRQKDNMWRTSANFLPKFPKNGGIMLKSKGGHRGAIWNIRWRELERRPELLPNDGPDRWDPVHNSSGDRLPGRSELGSVGGSWSNLLARDGPCTLFKLIQYLRFWRAAACRNISPFANEPSIDGLPSPGCQLSGVAPSPR